MDSGLDDLQFGDVPSPVPVREGLPPRYRMRADAHYVEQLDSSLFSSPVRFLDVRSIDPLQKDEGDGKSAAAAFVESVRRHGVLQPLLVRSRAGRFQVIAGGKRLAAALEVGLREVPCLVERIDDEQARALAAASNVAAGVAGPGVQVRPDPPEVEAALGAIGECLAAVASSAGLLSRGSTLTQAVAVDLVRAEAFGAIDLLLALRVLKGGLHLRRRPVSPRAVLQRAIEQTGPERRLRELTVTVVQDGTECPSVSGDETLLSSSVGGLVAGAAALLDTVGARTVKLGVVARGDAVEFGVEHEGAELSPFWRSTLADDESREMAVPGGVGAVAALARLRAARQIARLHGGRMTVDCSEGSTRLAIAIPSVCS